MASRLRFVEWPRLGCWRQRSFSSRSRPDCLSTSNSEETMPLPTRRRESRSESLWAIGAFLTLTAAFVLVMELRFPYWTDPEFAARRECVLESSTEFPDRPLLAVLGSSRAGTGFMPEELAPIHDPEGRE